MHKRSDSSAICKRCRKINLGALTRRSHTTKIGEVVIGWRGRIDQAKFDNCPLCQLIMKAFNMSKEEMTSQNTHQLLSFSSRRIVSQGWATVDTTLLSLDRHIYRSRPQYIVYQPKGTEIVRLLGPHVDFGLVRSWLQYCEAQHGRTCTSVRDVEGLNSISSLKFIDCETNTIVHANGMPYVALSYQWGSETSNQVPFVTSLPDGMPKTIKDAISATRAMGFRYLWVDRYCINQSCGEEVAEQVQKMDVIYNHAELTIIAAAGQNAECGLPGISPRSVLQPSARIGRHHLVSAMADPRSVIESSAWNQRGWTYQEGLLSRRRLVFTPSQVYFECCGMYCCEALNFPLSSLHVKDSSRFRASFCGTINLGMFPRQLGRTEWEVVERITEYSAKSLSNTSDILDGVSGVLRVLKQGRHRVRHCKGVPFLPRPPKPSGIGPKNAQEIYNAYKWSPTVGFCAGLCWTTRKCLKRRVGFPSWSWTGWEGAVNWTFYECEWKQIQSNSDIQFKVQLIGGKECGLDEYFSMCNNVDEPISNTLIVSGLVIPVQIGVHYYQWGNDLVPGLKATVWSEDGIPVSWKLHFNERGLDVRTLGPCLAIELARQPESSFPWYLMIVAETERGTYQRVGLTDRRCHLSEEVEGFAKIQMDLQLE
ncbi:uncharacterized protein NECHADRAFT_87161 [Fusarium vanettenii 77-13-4]|uniref:Heterokaryon incompatibility domain-containing protein n=1 Tax=Fusarium vanettenii (strain ATCC MYA-4622 / CBS 123669 / FGSC 9596 / NRRL 45880 / 77-13-4) TaxID=660122 RepID=C7ZIJ0_FUSV7|nr:uncharacterized protein NECHADRAFT_87161 [Fusarium vanettenii 77-13-4]EEU36271.1 hypothetical protein NECHADRAFT_87161 [Fusarium vanettenii 77-13-4]